MSISFERNRAQLRCESFLNCSTFEEWDSADFKNCILDASKALLLSEDLYEDSKDLYFKGILSLFEALKSIEAGLFSWATIKLYYSVYYFLRSTMASNGVAIIRQRSLYHLRASEGEKPVTKNGKKYNSDHSGTIMHFIDLFTGSDVLLSQSIEFSDAYNWLMERREQINYRERTFNEPSYSTFWEYIALQKQAGNLEALLNMYIQDKYILCFQEENAVLALPLKRAILTREELDAKGVKIAFTDEQKRLLTDLLPFKIAELTALFG